nr:uncharacterized protein LOC117275715 [Nicotiana tomentosiformis]
MTSPIFISSKFLFASSEFFISKSNASSSRPAGDKTLVEPRPEECVPGGCVLTSDFKTDRTSPVPSRCEPISRYICSITEGCLKQVRKDCNWKNKEVIIPAPEEDITTHVKGFLSVYTYPFTLGPLDPVFIDFCRQYRTTLGQIHHSFWRIIILIRFFVNKIEGIPFTIDHLIRLYSPRFYRGGLIKLQRRATKVLFSIIDEDKDRVWMRRFIRVKTSDLIPAEKMPFPAEWNMKPVAWTLGTILNLMDWVRDLASTSTYVERSWRDLSKGRWEAKTHGKLLSHVFVDFIKHLLLIVLNIGSPLPSPAFPTWGSTS